MLLIGNLGGTVTWRLGIDLGTNSLGWAALELEKDREVWKPSGLMDSGVRIFSDGRNPKDRQSNAAKRREPRSARKNRDRGKRRSARLMRQLTMHGLMPADPTERKKLEGGKNMPLVDTDPWILRARALEEKITPHQLGRAIFHLHQRRGFKSNRKTDSGDSESGKVYDAIKRTKKALESKGARTLGELFGRPRLEVAKHNETAPKGQRLAQPLARVRSRGAGAKAYYDYYPTRELILDEFDQIWESQKRFYPDLTSEAKVRMEKARKELRDTIEWQHPLKSPPVGKCTFIAELRALGYGGDGSGSDEDWRLRKQLERAPKALPSSQRARIYQEVNALKIMPSGKAGYTLGKEQRDLVANSLLNSTKRTFDQLRKLLKLSEYDRFNTESEKRKHLDGDLTALKMKHKDRWGASWFDLDLQTQDEIVDRLINEEEEEKLVVWLCNTYGLEKDQALRIADCPLVAGHGNLSKLALDRILPHLETGLIYSDAVVAAGFSSHSQFGTGEVHDEKLPYYGEILERSVAFGTSDPNDMHEKRIGKVANPTVHVALNQIRAVVNDLMRRFGAPEQIVLELARDLPLSARGKGELESRQKQNQDANDVRRKRLAEEFKQPDSYDNRMRLRLYEDLEALDKRCVFSGEQIGAHNLFSPDVEVEHILPFSRTFDDSYSNKTLSMCRANRDKKNQTPFEAFGHSPNGYDWEQISLRAAALPANKAWRFAPDAMERYENEERDFLARQLTDTQYISRLAKGYLEAIYGGQGHEGSKNHVWVINGRLTADLRHIWGLNSVLRGHNEPESVAQKKNRNDHRHHAIDAIVIACTDRAMLKKAADKAKENEQMEKGALMKGVPTPWGNDKTFRIDVENSVRNIVVSHKPDHGIQGAMHNDTAYGIPEGKEGEPDKKGVRLVVTRKSLDSESFKKPDDLEKIRDHTIKMKLLEETYGLTGKEFKEALLEAARAMVPPVYKVRIEENLRVIPFKDRSGKEYKAYKGDGNYCYDIWVNEKGKWTGEVISTFQAYQLSRKDPKWWQKPVGRNGQKLLMRLRKNDYLQIEHDEKRMIVQVYKFSEGKINMAEHLEANVDARVRAKELKSIQKAPSALQKSKAKRVTVGPSGVVKIYQ